MSFDQSNKPIFRAAFVMQPQSSCPIALGQVGYWLDGTDDTVKMRNADGSDTAGGGGANTWKEACRLATAAALGAGVYDAAALTFTQSVAATEQIDGKTVAVGDRVLVKDQVDQTQNGIYVVTVKGTGSVKQKLTRAPDCNQSEQFEPGFVVPIAEGTVNADSVFEFTADAPFVMDTDNATFSPMPLSITYATAAEIADLDSTAESAGVSDTAARGDHKHAVVNLNGSSAKVVADANVIGGIPVEHRVLVAGGANANTDVVLTHKTRVTDVKVVLKGAGTAGSLITVKNGATAITDAIDISGGLDKACFRDSSIDDAQHEIAAAGTLRVTNASTGGDCPSCEVYVRGFRVT